jgi:Protein of unknown function (DUF3089)
MKLKLFYLLLPFLVACGAVKPKGTFDSTQRPTAPNYANSNDWAALPDKQDKADLAPYSLQENQANAPIDVFFLYPTVYTGSKKYQTNWNAPIDYAPFNEQVDNSPIKFQASIFNNTGKIYAPRYRQAHIKCYYLKNDIKSCEKAFELAYEDVKNAFEYYLKNYNQGRPIMIVGHSQGTTHGMRLVKEFFDGKPLQKQLVAAYLVGIPVPKDYFKSINICENPDQTGCVCTWRTWKKGFEKMSVPLGKNIAVVNPLTWKTDETYAPASLNLGGVVSDFKPRPNFTDAQNHNGILWASKPHFPGSALFIRKNYHIGDFNLFYMNVRENAANRTKYFLKK